MESFTWRTAEYVHKEKTSDWYWTVGIITVALVVVSIIFGNTLFGIVLAIGAFTLTMFASREPNDISVDVTVKGISIDKTLYPFTSLQSFYVDEHHAHGPRLLLKSKKVVMPLIAIPVHTDHVDDLKTFLSSRLKEEVFNQGIIHTLLERIGF